MPNMKLTLNDLPQELHDLFVLDLSCGTHIEDVKNAIDASDEGSKIAPRIALNAWRIMIQADADELWRHHDSVALWSYFGHDSQKSYNAFCKSTFFWILSLLKPADSEQDGNMSHARIYSHYSKYLEHFTNFKELLLQKMRQEMLQKAIQRHKTLLMEDRSCPSSLCSSISDQLAVEAEADSLTFYFLRRRPALFVKNL